MDFLVEKYKNEILCGAITMKQHIFYLDDTNNLLEKFYTMTLSMNFLLNVKGIRLH